MNIALALIIFFLVALLVWAIAEVRYKGFVYVEDVPHHEDPTANHDPNAPEMNIRDIMRENSTKGFNAVD